MDTSEKLKRTRVVRFTSCTTLSGRCVPIWTPGQGSLGGRRVRACPCIASGGPMSKKDTVGIHLACPSNAVLQTRGCLWWCVRLSFYWLVYIFLGIVSRQSTQENGGLSFFYKVDNGGKIFYIICLCFCNLIANLNKR